MIPKRRVAKPQNSKKRVVVQSIRDGDKQTMPADM